MCGSRHAIPAGQENFMTRVGNLSTRSDHTSADVNMNGYTLSLAPKACLTPYLNPRTPHQRRSQQTDAGVFISAFCSVRIVSSVLHSNIDVEETAYSRPIYSDETIENSQK